ncbi:NACHT, LRR and PYD domains-containing protein 4 [Sapajus apella]|uniref:NACHT, LRR and PYD domains-containing protein 4 n=1 Tax=Sapajus apella TaxID=9515 RepID=A0A6J3GLN1_SAPAP|nr:NACHT, LRR and PYD domains-containing protein 4 [Sapajus apella]
MAASFFSDFGLMWYLEELKKEEFRKFKEHLKQLTSHLELKPIPWAEVKKASREELANLLIKHYEEQQAWNVTLRIFQKMDRKDLCVKVTRERTGYTKTYQDHAKKKFSHLWSSKSVTDIHRYFHQEVKQEECDHLDRLFASKETGKQPRTVVIQGAQGIGKTTLLMKLMWAWSDSRIYRDRFLYAFYFCCREMRELPVVSLADLICREWPDPAAPVTEIMSQPERLLFIIDSFEQLEADVNQPDSDLCGDWKERRPVQVVLSSLLRKKMLPEASLLVAVKPTCPKELRDRVAISEIYEPRGFDESDRLVYFCCFFQDPKRAMEAFSLVRENQQLFALCQIPLLCWLLCTALKQEMQKGKDLAVTCQSTTSVYASFIFNLFTPEGATGPTEQSQCQLKGLCALAAEGMWTDTFEFGDEDLRRHGIADADIPALLGTKVLLKFGERASSYTFIHMCIQEFCAAMFYLLKSHLDHPHPAVRSVEELLVNNFKKARRPHWIFLGCFLIGLLNKKEQEKLNGFFGFQLSQEIKQQLEQCLKSLGEQGDLQGQVDALAIFYCLFEMQEPAFVRQAVNLLQEGSFHIVDNSDLVVSAYCLKYCSSLRKLSFSIQNVFKKEDTHSSVSDYSLICWHHICSVFTTNGYLREVQVQDSTLSEPAFVTWCNQLRHPSCRLQKLGINNVSFSGQSSHLFEVLFHQPDLKYLSLTLTKLSRDDVKSLCDALNSPAGNIEELALVSCELSPVDCEVFAFILTKNKKLKYLNVSCNRIDEGVRHLCEALCRPDTVLTYLMLAYCHLSEQCWEYVSEMLLRNSSLRHVDLGANILKDEGLKTLCKALKHPDCRLDSLCLVKCFITAAGCEDLALVLISNQNLKNLEIGCNEIGDVGVKLLCAALKHPDCHVEVLGLEDCALTSACCKDLASVLTSSKTLQQLNLTLNALDHGGVVVLCEALRHPECALRVLGLKKADFGEETQVLLMAEEERNPKLTIVDHL